MSDGKAPRTVLLVEDDARDARMLARMLREDGFDVYVVFDGAAAIRRLSEAPVPDILVTDYHLPHVDGFVVAEFALGRRSDVRVVFITGWPEQVRARNHGRAVVIGKPVPYEELARVVLAS